MPVAFMIYVVLCLLVAFLGRRSKLGALRTMLLAFLLTPLVAFVYLLLFASLDDKSEKLADRAHER